MKTSFWDRVLMFLYVLIVLAFGVCMALRPFGVDLLGNMFAGIEQSAGRFLTLLIGLGLAAIVALLSVYMLMMIFHKGKRRVPSSFVSVDPGDGGQVHIALSALAQMARQAVGRVKDVRDMKIDVAGDGDAVAVTVSLTLAANAHVPTVTKNMRNAIRNSIESNCGVAVRDVEIIVGSLEDEAQKAEKKKARWLSGARRKEREQSVEAAAAQEAAAPLPEIPAPEPEPEPEAQEAEEDWTGSFAPLEESAAAEPADAEDGPDTDADFSLDLDGNFVVDDEEDEDEDEAAFEPSPEKDLFAEDEPEDRPQN